MAGNDTGYPSSSPSTSGKRSPISSDWGRFGSCSSADQAAPSALTASQYQTSHGSMESLLHDLGHNAKANAGPGELWISAKDNEDPWPVVICDEELLQTLLEGKARPVNARREDGSWYEGYGPGGGLAGQRCFPTMRLGTAKLCWTPWKRLVPFDILNVKGIQESAENLELVRAYAEAIEQYGRNDLTYWKDKLFAKQLSKAETLEPVEVKKETDASTNKRKQQLSKAAALPKNNVEKRTFKRKIGKSGFKYPPRVIAGIKVWDGDDSSDSGDEAVREHKKIKLEHEMDGDLFLSSVPPGQAPAPQASMVEEEGTSTKESLRTTSSVTKKVKSEDEKDDDLFLSPPSQSQASGQRPTEFYTYSEMTGRDRAPTDQLSEVRDRFLESMGLASTKSTSPSPLRFMRTQNSPSRHAFEKIVSSATATTQNSPSRPLSEKSLSPGEPYHPNRLTLRDTSTESAAKQSASPLPSTISLYIGNPHTTFPIPTSSWPLSPYLLTKLSHDPTVGAYIMSPLLASIEPQDFEPVASYLKGLSDAQACLTPTHPGTYPAEEFRKCAMTFHIATQLGITALAAAAIQRLAEIRVKPTLGFLRMVKYLFRHGVLSEGGGLRKMVVRYLAMWYWELMRVDEGALDRILAADSGLEEAVRSGLQKGKRGGVVEEWVGI